MNWVDIAIIAITAWFVFAAFNAGLIREVVTILGAILAVALAGLFYADFATDIEVVIEDSETARVVSFGVIFGAVVLVSQLLAMFLKQASSILLLGLFDSMGGAIIGFVKAFIFIEFALIAAITFPSLELQETIDESSLAPVFLDFIPFLKLILPTEFKNAIEAY